MKSVLHLRTISGSNKSGDQKQWSLCSPWAFPTFSNYLAISVQLSNCIFELHTWAVPRQTDAIFHLDGEHVHLFAPVEHV